MSSKPFNSRPGVINQIRFSVYNQRDKFKSRAQSSNCWIQTQTQVYQPHAKLWKNSDPSVFPPILLGSILTKNKFSRCSYKKKHVFHIKKFPSRVCLIFCRTWVHAFVCAKAQSHLVNTCEQAWKCYAPLVYFTAVVCSFVNDRNNEQPAVI